MNKYQKMLFIKEFGIKLTLKTFYYQSLIKLKKNNNNLYYQKLNELKINFLDKKYSNYINQLISEYKQTNDEMKISKIIWQFWMQGNYKEVPIVDLCLKSVNINKPKDIKQIIITKDNLKEYTDISPNIYEKYNNNLISNTHFSDILRMNLLFNHGGIWLDATIFSNNRFDYIFKNDFWTIKRNDENSVYISKGKWTGYAIGGKKNDLFFYLMNELFKKYWEDYDVLIDFFLIDLFIALLYSKCNEVREKIDNNVNNNINVQKLWPILSEEYNKNVWDNYIANTELFKLSWRIPMVYKVNNCDTFLGFIKNKVGDKNEQ